MRELIVDNFAGGGGASTGIELALGISPDIAINHDAVALAMHEANHPATRHLCTSVWKVDPDEIEGPIGLGWFSPDCFPAGTLVLTDRGYRQIETIEVGTMVLTHRGRWRKVTERSMGRRPLVTLRGHGHPGLTLSIEHPIWARLRSDRWSNANPRGYVRMLQEADWCPASMLDKGWYWATPSRFPDADSIPPVAGRGMTVDARLLWLAGRYVGDGWSRLTETRAEVVITCGRHEMDNLRDWLAVWPRSGDRSGADELAWHERETGTAYQFTTSHRGLVEWLRTEFGHRAECKGIPAWLLGAADSAKDAFLAGYLSADGWRNEEFAECRTVSKALAFGLKALLSSLGKVVIVHLLPNSTTIEGRDVSARNIYMLRWRHKVDAAHNQVFIEDLHQWAPIREQIDVGDVADVFNIGVEEDESYVAEGVVVHNCKHFSKAKGGKPVEKGIRDLAWVVVRWARRKAGGPRVIILENVEEFRTWGPLGEDGRPCPLRKGATFKRWVGELKRLGYTVDWRELRACDYGAPTIRKRLFLIARRDGEPIVWPAPTHGDPTSEAVRDGRLKPWRTAAEIIDWSLPCHSIFLTPEEAKAIGVRRPLADATMARTAKGVWRYVLEAVRPFIVPITHVGDTRVHSLDDPLRTITTARRGEQALVTPFITKFNTGATGHAAGEPLHTITAAHSETHPGGAAPLGIVAPHLMTMRNADKPFTGADQPTHTITAGGARQGLVAAFLAQNNIENGGGAKAGRPVDAPVSTILQSGSHQGLVTAFLAQNNYQEPGHDARTPMSTIVAKGSTQSVIAVNLSHLYSSNTNGGQGHPDFPAKTVTTGGHHAICASFLTKYYSTDQDPDLAEPLHTATTKPRFGLAEVLAAAPPFGPEHHARARQVADLLRAHGLWDEREFVTVDIDGITCVIVDLGMRMLTPRELFRAQGFPESYIIDRRPDGTPISKSDQVAKCGNSVCPPIAAALVAANFATREIVPAPAEAAEFYLEAAE